MAMSVRISKADFVKLRRIGRALFQPLIEHGLGHRVIGGGGQRAAV